MHPVLGVQHVGVPVIALKEGLIHPQVPQLLVLDYRPQLLVVPQENHLEAQTGMGPTPLTQRDTPSLLSCPPVTTSAHPGTQDQQLP